MPVFLLSFYSLFIVDESSSPWVESQCRVPESDPTGLFKIVEMETTPEIAKRGRAKMRLEGSQEC
jgi:hypothetical protein